MISSIKRTLKRLSGKIYFFNPINWYPLLLEGISVEFGRVKAYKDAVYASTVPNENMDPDSIVDFNDKYGIPQTLNGTNAVKIARIIEKANLNGFPGPEWLQEQIQAAGFPLYVIENKPQEANVRQWGTFQWGTEGVQWGLEARFENPDNIPGFLCVSSPPSGAGRAYLNQYGSFQWGTSGVQWGTLNPLALNPQPFVYLRTNDPKYWGFYFTLSPFSDRVATLESEFITVTQQELDYLCNLVIQLKMVRNWCIIQAKVS